MKKIIVIVVFAFLTIACNSEEELITENIEFTLISDGNLFGDGAEGISKQNLIIQDQDSWVTLINKMDIVNNVSDSFTETAIDFSEFMIIAVFEEVKSNGAYYVDLEILTDSESVFVNRIDESPNGNLALIIASPGMR